LAQESGYKPYGMFGMYSSNDCFAKPIEKDNIHLLFEKLFGLERSDKPGLSLIIPFVNEEINLHRLAYSVIEQYFYPILEAKLEVEIIEEDETILLNKSSIVNSVHEIDFQKLVIPEDKRIRSKESLIHLFEFANWTLGLSNEDFVTLNEPGIEHKPRWTKNLYPDEKIVNEIREKFESNDRVAFKVPLKYHPMNEFAKMCWFAAYLEKDTSVSKPENIFVRDGITITGISSLDKGLVRGIVVIHDINLARMFGDSENPAHTEWQAESRNFKGRYVDGAEALAFMKNTLKRLYELLQRPIEGIQKDLLIDFFSIPIESTEVKKQKNLPNHEEPGEDDTNEPKIPILRGKKQPVIVEKILSGLKISRNPLAEELPESIQIKLGYDVQKGNPINSYQDLDFDVSKVPIVIESSGVYFTKKEKNELEFIIEDNSDFEIKLSGFDEKRDLFLKLK
jgi:hypothetical protein